MNHPKQLRMDPNHKLLLSMLRTYTSASYDADVGKAAVRCLAEQVAAAYADRGEQRRVETLLRVMNDAAREIQSPAGAEEMYRYDPASRQVQRWGGAEYRPIPLAYPVAM